jgi:dTDP-4-dehydrorhamnose reductase
MSFNLLDPNFKFLLTGSTGQVGHEIFPLLKKISNVWAPSRSEFDLYEIASLPYKVQQYNPNMIINLAAYTDVDGAELDIKSSNLINHLAPGVLAKEAKKLNIPLIHLSTDYVFDGKKGTSYTETDAPNPINVYGQSKLEGEREIEKYHDKYLIIRTAWVYNKIKGKNFYRTIVDLCKTKDEINVVENEIGNPTSANFIAKKILNIITEINDVETNKDKWGLFHLVEKDVMSRYDFACRIFSKIKNDPGIITQNIKAIRNNEYKTIANRPKYSVLNTEKFYKTFVTSGKQ